MKLLVFSVLFLVTSHYLFADETIMSTENNDQNLSSGADTSEIAQVNQVSSLVDTPSEAPGIVTGVNSEFASTGIENGEEDGPRRLVNANYFGILYGPSVKSPSSYQPSLNGAPDADRPVIIKNFVNLGYNVSDMVTLTGTAYWLWQPVMKQQMQMQDPFVRASYNSIFYTENMNLYGDVRFHIPATALSRENDLRFGVQSVQVLTYSVPGSRFTLGAYGSVRGNSYGGDGFGRDLELYFAPNMSYQVKSNVSFTFLYEMQGGHSFGNRKFPLEYDGTDIEPGVSWDISQNLMVNPYFHIPISGTTSFKSTSIGMMLNWVML